MFTADISVSVSGSISTPLNPSAAPNPANQIISSYCPTNVEGRATLSQLIADEVTWVSIGELPHLGPYK